MSDRTAAQEKNRRKAEEKKQALRRRIAEMLPIPEAGCLDILLSLKTRLLAARVAASPLGREDADMIRRLIADMVTVTASLDHLAVLFEKTDEIRAPAHDAPEALMNAAACWKAGRKIGNEDLDVLDAAADLLYDVLKETKVSEYKAVLKIVGRELAR